MLLSIIIPVYNVEEYIERCLESCLTQSMAVNDYEIVVVNDGSTDRSLNIVEKISRKSENITIISQSNSGLSVARNVGLKAARGEYVWFVDSDDWIGNDCITTISSFLNNELDMLQIQYAYYYEREGIYKNGERTLFNGVQSGEEVMKNGGLPSPVPFTIYKKEFLERNNLFFVKGIYYEDSEYKPRATLLAKKIASCNIICYYYRQRMQGSITSHFSIKHASDLVLVNRNLITLSEKHNKRIKQVLYRKISMNLNTLFHNYNLLNDSEKKQVLSMLEINKDLFGYMLKSGDLLIALEGFVFKQNIPFGLFIYKALK